jgi:hypothetical protein
MITIGDLSVNAGGTLLPGGAAPEAPAGGSGGKWWDPSTWDAPSSGKWWDPSTWGAAPMPTLEPVRPVVMPARSSSVSLLSNLSSLRAAMGGGVVIARPVTGELSPGAVPSPQPGPPVLDRTAAPRAPRAPAEDGGIPTVAIVAGGVAVLGAAYFLLRKR